MKSVFGLTGYLEFWGFSCLCYWVKEAKYYYCTSAENCHLLFCWVFLINRFPKHLISLLPPLFISFAQSQILLSIFLFLFLHPPLLSQAFLASLSSLPFTPSQDKQPLFWGMSAICSKKLTSFWMLFRAKSQKGGKITNLVLFHNLSLCFSFFLVYAALFFSSFNSLTTWTSLTGPSRNFPDSWVSTPFHLYVWPCFQPVWPHRVFRFPTCLLEPDLFCVRNFHHSSPINTWGENRTRVLRPLSSLCRVPLRETHTHKHTLQSFCGKTLPIWHLLIGDLFGKVFSE